MNLKNWWLLHFVQTYQEQKRFPYMEGSRDEDQEGKEPLYMEMSRDSDKKRKNFLIWKCQVTRTRKNVFIFNEMQLQNQSLTIIHKNKTLLSATCILSHSPVAHSTTSLDKPSCTDYVDFGKFQDSIGQYAWSGKDSNYSVVKLKVFRKDDNKEFRLVQNLTMG